MEKSNVIPAAAALLSSLRRERGISQLQLADEAGVNASVVLRAERGGDAKLSTWEKLFDGLGYAVRFEVQEQCEEAGDLLAEEAYRRESARREGLCAGKRRFY
jgi:transcriptional regulator with XRE-family HTH domain